ncbi:MAG TPA: LytTR family DNA-binding domain-containing protein [Gemmataceae bacterium]|jgi:two-component system LytT family response regulator|nr:LytTR family DNA-binding domain-containing protein [Gemmataceae bacterium]
MSIKVLIVDDEPLARQRIRKLLEGDSDVQVIGECADGLDAVNTVRENKPDLVFLDVQMPALDGFSVLEALGPHDMPTTIFVTAYDRYAIKAFEVHALDYLLKPFDRDRFRKALERAKAQLAQSRIRANEKKLEDLLTEVTQDRKGIERIVIKSTSRVFFLRTDEIDWIEAAGNYLKLHAGKEFHLLRETMNGLDAKLDPNKFLRIHRSTIVNVERIKELQPFFHGDYLVILKDGTQLTLSRTHRPKLQHLLGEGT